MTGLASRCIPRALPYGSSKASETERVTFGNGCENMAGHTQNDVFFDDAVVVEEQILALGDDSFKHLLQEFNVERCHNAMMCVACGLNAFDKAIDHAKVREQIDQTIADFHCIEWKSADMATKLDAARMHMSGLQ